MVAFLELENARLFVTTAQGILARIWVISELMSELGFPANVGIISYNGFNYISQNSILIFLALRIENKKTKSLIL